MAKTAVTLLFLALTVVGLVFLVLGPLTALGVMLWHWKRELNESARLRQVRSTQVR